MNLNVVIDGEDHVLPMDDIPLEMPILSVREIVRKGDYATFRDGGDYLKNVRTGHKMRFVEKQGVHFTRVQVKAPSPGRASESLKPVSGFSRPRR